MRKRAESRIKQIMAVLLAAVLIVGMIWETVPLDVLAQESAGADPRVSGSDGEPKQEESRTVSGNDVEPKQEETRTVSGSDVEPKQEESQTVSGSDGEPEQEESRTVSGNDVEPKQEESRTVSGNDGEPKQEESRTVSGNDGEPKQEETPPAKVRLAEEGCCRIGQTAYTSLAEAVTAAASGDTIWMTADDSSEQRIEIGRSLTIELQGFTLANTAFKITGTDTSVSLNDRMGTARVNTGKYLGFRAAEHSRCDATIYITGGASLTINGTTGSDRNTGTVISECGVRDLIKAVFLGQGALTINGGTFAGEKYSGHDALFVYSGRVTINDGYFYSNCGLSYYSAPSDDNPLSIRKGVFDGGMWIERSGSINGQSFSGGTQSVENVKSLFLSSSVGSTVLEGSTKELIRIGSGLFLSGSVSSQILPDGTGVFVGSVDESAPEQIRIDEGSRIILQPLILGGDGSTPIEYRWEKDDNGLDHAGSSYVIESYESGRDDGKYRLTASQGGADIQVFYLLGEGSGGGEEPSPGPGWEIDEAGKLTIQTDAGMADWISGGRDANGAKVKSVELKAGVTGIGNYAFMDCASIKNIVLPDSVKDIGSYAFKNCCDLTDICIPEGVECIEERTFEGCSNLKKVIIPESVTRIEEAAFSGCNRLADMALPRGLQTIGDSAFYYCSGLKEIHIPNGVTSIADQAFRGCGGLEIVTLPDHPDSIGRSAFSGCSSLKEIVIPEGVKAIGDSAFFGCSGLKSVTLPESVECIDSAAFQNCGGLTGIRIPGKITGIKSRVFSGCSGLMEIVIPGSVARIETSAFQGCSGLKEIVIPNGVTSIDAGAFRDCSGLMKVTVERETPCSVSNTSFDNCGFVSAGEKGIHVPEGTVADYKTVWKAWAEYIAGDSPAPDAGNDRKKVEEAKQTVQETLDRITVDNDTTEESLRTDIQEAVNGKGVTGVAVTVKDFQKKEATEEAAGSITGSIVIQSGSVSDRVEINKIIEKLPGKVDKEVDKDEKAPGMEIATPTGDLAGMVLEPEEQEKLAEGIDIKIILNVKDASGKVDSGEKKLVEEGLKEFAAGEGTAAAGLAGASAVGQYLDISLYKKIGEGVQQPISQTRGKIKITIDVPESLKNTDSNTRRIYAVIRVHEGETKILRDIDIFTATITIETDRFSTYAIVYKDIPIGGSSGNEGSGGNGGSSGNGGSGNQGSGGSGGNGGNGGSSGNEGSGNQGSGGNGGSGNQGSGGNEGSGGSGGSGDGENADGGSSVLEQTSSRDNEPKTGDDTRIQLYATLSMIAGFTWLLLYFKDSGEGMTEETKKALVSRLTAWAKRGGRLRKYLALAAIFVLLVYYHGTKKLSRGGRKVCVKRKAG